MSSFPNGSTLTFALYLHNSTKKVFVSGTPFYNVSLHPGVVLSLGPTVVHCSQWVGTLGCGEELVRKQEHVRRIALFPIQVMCETADLES